MENTPEVPPMVAKILLLRHAAIERVGSGAKFMDLVVEYSDRLKAKYPDTKLRRAYHVLIGSTLPKNTPGIIEEDFPGDDSIVHFLESLA